MHPATRGSLQPKPTAGRRDSKDHPPTRSRRRNPPFGISQRGTCGPASPQDGTHPLPIPRGCEDQPARREQRAAPRMRCPAGIATANNTTDKRTKNGGKPAWGRERRSWVTPRLLPGLTCLPPPPPGSAAPRRARPRRPTGGAERGRPRWGGVGGLAAPPGRRFPPPLGGFCAPAPAAALGTARPQPPFAAEFPKMKNKEVAAPEAEPQPRTHLCHTSRAQGLTRGSLFAYKKIQKQGLQHC